MHPVIPPFHWAARHPVFVGVVHVRPLPGSPRWRGDMPQVLAQALADARAYARGGADALVLENFGDLPFSRGPVGPETVAGLAVVAAAVRAAVKLPIGFNVLRNDPRAGLALAAATHGAFIRVNVHTGVMVADQGVIEGDAHGTLRERARLAPDVQILADVHVKHAAPLAPRDIGAAARDMVDRGLADALIITGEGTGLTTALSDVESVRQACPRVPLLIGSGVDAGNVVDYLRLADGVIVGSSLKFDGRVEEPVDVERVRQLARVIRKVPAAQR